MWIARAASEDLEAITAILAPSALHLEIDRELEREMALPWVLRLEPRGPVVGFLLAWSVADEMQLLELATDLDFRRRGVARALLRALVTETRAQRKRLLLLEVRASNQAALCLYRSEGFVTTGVRKGYYSDNEDALEMRLTLDPETGAIIPDPDGAPPLEA
ncbi:MAG TPA: GNAT family N-acetyltransferase [Polyangiaceae bacterium]|jgi:ribosomal-protein-alanine N-acetyltransferase